MRPKLGPYLQVALRKSWEWGVWDCSNFAAQWIVANGHRDPLDTIAPYSTERMALHRVVRGGGLVKLWTHGAEHSGLKAVEAPRMGDIGVLSAPQESGPAETVGIYTGDKWAMLGVSGLIFAHPAPLAMWRP